MKLCLLAPALLIFLAGCSPQFIKQKISQNRAARRALPTRFEWRSQPEVPRAGLPAIWSLKVLDLTTDKDNPKGVTAYEAPHGVSLHLLVVSRDLSQYAHLYPEPRDYGNFLLRPVIPQPGAYQLFADYVPIGGNPPAPGFPTLQSQKFLVTGDNPAPKEQPLTPSAAQNGWLATRVADRAEQEFVSDDAAKFYEVRLQAAPWRAGQSVALHYRVLDANGAPVTDLDKHLGAAAYGVALSADGNQFVRLEAQPRDPMKPDETILRGTFPTPGLYKIWCEFRRQDRLIVAPFVVRVEKK